MANSRIPGMFDASDGLIPARTPGSLGLNDQGDPNVCSLLSDTPGSLGVSDYASQDLEPLLSVAGGNLWTISRLNDGRIVRTTATGVGSGEALDPKVLKTVFPAAKIEYLRQVADELNRDPKRFALETILRRAHFFAQVREEAGDSMSPKQEDMTYSVSALKGKEYYKSRPEEAEKDGYIRDKKNLFTQKPSEENIANKLYSSKYGNGAPSTGDGWRFRGRGLIQVTWRANYQAITKKYAEVYGDRSIDFEKNPDLMVTFPYSVRSAVCFWLLNNCAHAADRGSKPEHVDGVTRIVNRYTPSYPERRKHFAEIFAAFN